MLFLTLLPIVIRPYMDVTAIETKEYKKLSLSSAG